VLTRQDSISFSYQRSQVTQTQTTGEGQVFDFTTQSVLVGYNRTMPDWTAGISGGMTLIDPAHRAYPTAIIKLSTAPERVTAMRLDLSRQAAPSFFFVSGALISNLAQVAVSHKLSRLLSVEAGVNYGYNETVPDRTVKFTSFTVGAGVKYKLTKTMILDFYYSYNDFKTEQPGLPFEVLRNVVGFSLTAEWK
jgi:opacity protein-like surface antigen